VRRCCVPWSWTAQLTMTQSMQTCLMCLTSEHGARSNLLAAGKLTSCDMPVLTPARLSTGVASMCAVPTRTVLSCACGDDAWAGTTTAQSQ
jgi:hypothetical protein